MEAVRGSSARAVQLPGLAFNKCIDVAGGVIDPDYTVEIKVILVDHGEPITTFKLVIALLKLFEKYADVAVTPLRVKVRKDGGFGSTSV